MLASYGLEEFHAPISDPVVNTVANTETQVANKHGVYKDKEKRKAYMRELMRKRRER